jgi:acyl-CoA synthetase (AMP-forming)/AMP-acid ligase II
MFDGTTVSMPDTPENQQEYPQNPSQKPGLGFPIARLGAIISPVPIQYGPFELEKAREVLEPSAFISMSNFKGKNFAADHSPVFGDDFARFAFGEDVPEGFTPISLDAGRSEADGFADYLAGLDISANDILSICWTSGTTGQPKGVPRSHNMWMASGRGAHDVADMQDGEAILNPFPMVNMAAIGGFLFPWLMRGSTLVLHHPLDLPVFLKQIEQEKIGYTIAPPALLNMLLKQREVLDAIDIRSLRAIGSGSAPLSEWMVKGYQEDYGIAILNVFGSNEGICLATDQYDVPDPADRARYFPRFGVQGFEWRNRAGAETVTRLVDLQSGEVVTEPGAQGEMEIQGATLFDGYWKSPGANAEVFTDDGFFRTGDVFEIVGDDLRYYKFVGRCKDIIVRGGVNISPDEIDNLLAGHPKVAEVAVVGYEDEIMGERVGAVVVPKPGETVSLDELTEYLRDKGMAVFKLPEQLRLVDEIPHNAVGKILRRELVELFDAKH